MQESEIGEIEENLLSPEDLKEFQEIKSLLNVQGASRDILRSTLGAATLITLIVVGNLLLSHFFPSIADIIGGLALFSSIGLIMLFAGGSLATYLKAKEKANSQYVVALAKFKRRISYKSGGGNPAPHYPVTGNYDPKRYYSYTASQRAYMRSVEIDADTYDSNVE